jgi:hypothetical protein
MRSASQETRRERRDAIASPRRDETRGDECSTRSKLLQTRDESVRREREREPRLTRGEMPNCKTVSIC